MVKKIVLCAVGCSMAMVLNAHVEHINNLALLNTMLAGGKKVVLKFSAVWCGPCRASLPLFEELSGNNNYKNVAFIEVDVEKGGEIANRYAIRGIPAFVCMNGNKVLGKAIGFDQNTRGKLMQLLDDLVKA